MHRCFHCGRGLPALQVISGTSSIATAEIVRIVEEGNASLVPQQAGTSMVKKRSGFTCYFWKKGDYMTALRPLHNVDLWHHA